MTHRGLVMLGVALAQVLLAVSIPLLLVAVGLLMSRAVQYFRTMQGQIDRVNQILREQLTGLRVVRAFVRDAFERQRFAVANDTLTDTALHTGRLMAALIPMAYLAQILMSVMMAALLFAIVPRALVCAFRVEELLRTPSSVCEPATALRLSARSGHGGVDVRALSLPVLWGAFGLVPQQTWLFAGTIGENIAYGRSGATEADVLAAAPAL